MSLGVTLSGQILGIQKTKLCKVIEDQQLTKSCCASDGDSHIGDYRELSILTEYIGFQ